MNAGPQRPDAMPADAMTHGQAARYLGIPFARLLELIGAGELARPLRRSELERWKRARGAGGQRGGQEGR